MDYYELRDCASVMPDFWTNTDLSLSGLSLGSFFQSVEYPGVCLEIITATDTPPGLSIAITHVGPVFTNCVDCNNGVLSGCTDPTSCNFNPCATIDDGSCFYNLVNIRILCNTPLTACDINANCE